jgi:hypothetical protein
LRRNAMMDSRFGTTSERVNQLPRGSAELLERGDASKIVSLRQIQQLLRRSGEQAMTRLSEERAKPVGVEAELLSLIRGEIRRLCLEVLSGAEECLTSPSLAAVNRRGQPAGPKGAAQRTRRRARLVRRMALPSAPEGGLLGPSESETVPAAGVGGLPTPPPDKPGTVGDSIEGVVRVLLSGAAGMQQQMGFLNLLRQRPELRVLRLVGERQDRPEVWLELQAPVPLRELLTDIDGVESVEVLQDSEGIPGFLVRLNSESSAS